MFPKASKRLQCTALIQKVWGAKKRGDFPGDPVVRVPIARTRVLSLVGKLTSPKLCSAKTEKDKSDMGLGIHCQIQVTLMIS